jgi:hypothetical protein
VREPVVIESEDGLSRFVLGHASPSPKGGRAEALLVRLEAGDLQAEAHLGSEGGGELPGFFRDASADPAGESEWQSYDGEVQLRVTGAGLEVELWHAFGPSWSAGAVVHVTRERLSEYGAEIDAFLS